MNRGLTVASYLALLIFGIAQGLLGSFFYGSGPAPAAALGFDVAIFATCLLGAWGLRTATAALAPAIGWFVAAFILASGTGGGSVLIAATTAGKVFLFGGALAATLGLITGFFVWGRPSPTSRPGGPLR